MVLTETGLAKVFQRVKSFIASQLNSKASAIHTHTVSDVTDFPTNYVTTDTTQTIGGNKEFTGTTKAHAVVPSATNAYDLGGSSYQWNNAYIKNYYYNGVQWGLDKANVWNTYQTIKGGNLGNEQSPNGRTCLYLTSNRDTVGQSGIYITKFRQNRGQGGLQPLDLHYLAIDVLENSVRTNGVLQLNVTDWHDENIPSGVIMFSTLSNAQLGSSLAPWKTLNGINPGALSLPSTATGCVDIKSTVGQYLKDNNTNIYEFTAPFDGWVCVGIVKGSLRIDNSTTSISSGSENLGYWHSYTIPFRKDDVIQIKINKMDPADDYVNDIMWKAYIYPCQGNV